MLTAAFKQQIKATPGPGQASPTQPMTPEQFQSWASPSSQQEPNLAQRVTGDVTEAGTKINKQIAGEGEFSGESPVRRGIEAGATAGNATLKTASEVIPKPIREVGKAAGNAVGQGFNFLQDKLASTKLFSDIGKLEAGGHINPKDNPEFYKLKEVLGTASAEGQVAGDIAAADQVGGGIDTAASMAKGVVKQVTKPAKIAPEAAAKASVETSKANAMKAHDLIDKEIRNTAEKYGDVGKALNHAEVTKGTEPIKVLASYPKGEALPTMSRLGKMNSLPAINFLRKQVGSLGKIKGDLVDTAKQNISVEDFKKTIEDKIDSSYGSQAARDAQKADIAKEMERLQKSYPDGIPTKEMDKLKSEQASESSSYKTTGFPSRFAPDTHSLIAGTAKDLVEKQGGEAPIEELNKWIQTHHDAIKVLEKMHGKTPHGGMFTRHVGGIAGEIAGLAGGMAVGHPFIGAMAGRGASEVVNNLLSSHFISNPLKRSIITNMKGVKPDVIQKALDFISQEEGSSPSNPTGPQESLSLPNDSKPPGKVQGAIPETSAIIKQATEYQPEFEKSVNEIAKSGDWEVHHGSVKKEERATSKLQNEGGKLRDANRSTFVVNNQSQLASVADSVKGQFGEFTRPIKNKFDMEGYKSAIINVMTPAGHEAEIAVTTPAMWEAKTKLGGQAMYKLVREKVSGWEDIEQKMLKLYQEAALKDGL